MKSRYLAPLVVCIAGTSFPHIAAAQSDILIDRGRLDRTTPAPKPSIEAPGLPSQPGASIDHGSAPTGIVVTAVEIDGATTLPKEVLQRIALEKFSQKPLTLPSLKAALAAINAEYDRAGFALRSAFAPPQRFEGGVVRLRVVEGYVSDVEIKGALNAREQQRFERLAAPVLKDRPLRQKTLDRALALLAATPGANVKASFQPVKGSADAVTLVLDATQKHLESGFDVNNQGSRLLGRTQVEGLVARNSLLRAGDRAELDVGFPAEPKLYNLAALSYLTPVGNNGATVRGSVSYLKTRPGGFLPDGDVTSGSIAWTHPLVRTKTRSADLLVSFDSLEADSAVFGQTISSNRLRVLRAGGSFVKGSAMSATSIAATVSAGLDILDARDGNPYFGGPSFVKFVVRGVRVQQFGETYSLTLRASGQYANEALPSSEEFYFGGEEFGRAFSSGAAYGERGVAGAAELSKTLFDLPAPFGKPKAVAFVDYGALDGERYRGPLPYALSSAGIGAALPISKSTLGVQLVRPLSGAENKSTRVLFNATASF